MFWLCSGRYYKWGTSETLAPVVGRGGNGRYLAETAEDYVHDVSNLSKNYPTHLGSHPNYDAAVQSQIDNVIEQFDVDVFDLDGLSDTQLINLLSEIENRALNTLSNWQPSRLN